jgi:hypothetical protein
MWGLFFRTPSQRITWNSAPPRPNSTPYAWNYSAIPVRSIWHSSCNPGRHQYRFARTGLVLRNPESKKLKDNRSSPEKEMKGETSRTTSQATAIGAGNTEAHADLTWGLTQRRRRGRTRLGSELANPPLYRQRDGGRIKTAKVSAAGMTVRRFQNSEVCCSRSMCECAMDGRGLFSRAPSSGTTTKS